MKALVFLAVLGLAMFAAGDPETMCVIVNADSTFTPCAGTMVRAYIDGKAQWLSLPLSQRAYDIPLMYDQVQGLWFGLPPSATAVVVYVNGLRYRRGTDYSLTNGEVKALSTNMTATDTVTVDYDL